MTARRLIGLAALGLAMLWPALGMAAAGRDLAAELKDAQAALASGDYLAAYRAYLDHSATNPLAQFSLGLFHQYGWGRAVDAAEACRWQEKAALGGIPAAQQSLADCLRHGVHRPADPAGAAHWYEQAARSGIVIAPCFLAEMYMAGEGVAKDPQRALELCRQPAEKGLSAARLRMALFYLEGDASVRDPAVALQWMQAAAQADHAEAQYRLGMMLRDGIGGPVNAALARWWLEIAAGQGWLPAYLPTADLYFSAPVDPATGLLPAADLAKAYLWTSAAARRMGNGPLADPANVLLSKVLSRMPETWRPDLDRRVDAHLAEVGGVPGERPMEAPAASVRSSTAP